MAVHVSTPAAFTERWANPPEHGPFPPATVPAAKTAAAAGDMETWVIAGGWAQFPAVDDTARYPGVLRIYDRAAPSEIIRVRRNPGATWEVTRGDQGTTPVAHAAGFTIANAVTSAGLRALARAVPSGNGLVLPAANIGTITWAGNTESDIARLRVPAGEAVPGSVYEAFAWGTYHTNNFPFDTRTIVYRIRWGPEQIGSYEFHFPWQVPAGDDGRFRIRATVNIQDGSRAACSAVLQIAERNGVDLDLPYTHTYLMGPVPGYPAGTASAPGVKGDSGYPGADLADGSVFVTTNADVDFRLTYQNLDNGGGMFQRVLASRVWRVA